MNNLQLWTDATDTVGRLEILTLLVFLIISTLVDPGGKSETRSVTVRTEKQSAIEIIKLHYILVL